MKGFQTSKINAIPEILVLAPSQFDEKLLLGARPGTASTTTKLGLESFVPRQEGLPDYKDQCRDANPNAAGASNTNVPRQEGFPDFKDQCRDANPDAAGGSNTNDNISQPHVPVPLATEVIVVNDHGEPEPAFVFRPSNSLVEALEAAQTQAYTLQALQDVCAAARERDATQESRMIVAAGGTQAIRDSMNAFPNDPEIQEFACSALWYLAATDDSAVASAGLSEVPKAMQALPMATKVQQNACGLLRSLAENDAICAGIVRAGGVLAILTAMRNHTNASMVQGLACGALSNLARADAALICQQGAIVDIVAAMKAHRDVLRVQEQGCAAIWNLAQYHEEGGKQIRQHGVSPAILAALSKYPENHMIQLYGDRALDYIRREKIQMYAH